MKLYSIDDENYEHDNVGDVLDALGHAGRLEVGAVYYEGDFQRLLSQQVLDVERVLEAANEYGYELVGDSWDNPLWATREARDELQILLNEWVKTHVNLDGYYVIVGGSRKLTVTEDDLPANT